MRTLQLPLVSEDLHCFQIAVVVLEAFLAFGNLEFVVFSVAMMENWFRRAVVNRRRGFWVLRADFAVDGFADSDLAVGDFFFVCAGGRHSVYQ